MKSAPFSYFVLMMLMMLICWHSANTFAAETLCVDCEVHKLQNDIQNDRIAVAIARLKNLKTRFPNRREPVLLLANAYAADGNDYWALNVLYEWYDTHPDDCEAVSFIVWQHIQMANTDDAKALMAQNKCSQNDAMTTRWHILDAYLKTLNGNQPEIKTNLPDTWPEDALMWKMLFEKGAVGTVAPVDFHLSMESGVTTNAQAGSPQDSTGTPVVSPMGHLEVGTRFTVPTRTFIRPALGVEARLNGFTAQSVKKYSSIDIAYLPGILFGRTTTLLLSYRGSLMMLAWPGKTLFRETHRAELELTHPNGQLFFANAGKRIYKENGRTRWELEAGYGRSKTLNGWTALLLSVNGRYYNAIGAPYDEIGAGLLAAAQFSLPRRFALKSGIGESADYFFNSGGPKGMDAFGINTRRRDWTIRHFDELWFPPLKKIKLGVRYEFNHRDSNANASNSNISYDYLEHRILLKISIGITANPLVPDVRNESSHVPLNYGLHTTDDNPGINSREIAEMMRMDEAARAASSCVE